MTRARLPLLPGSFVRARALPDGAVVVTDAEGRFELRSAAGAPGAAPRPDPAATFAARRRSFMQEGVSRHVMLLRDASRAMDEGTARRALDRVFEGPARHLHVDLEGDDPLDAWDAARVLVDESRRRARAQGRRLTLGLATSLAAMSHERLAWLFERGVMLRVPFDAEAPRGVAAFHAHAASRGVDATRAYLNATLTLSRDAAGVDPRALVDALVGAGVRYVRVRPVEPFGLAPELYRARALPARDFAALYDRVVDEVLARNLAGELLVEMRLALALERILDRSPAPDRPRVACGSGAPMLAYAADGSVHTCAAAALHEGASGRLRLGHVETDAARSLVRHESLRATQAAGHLDALPGCDDCAYNPYCGACAVHSLATRGRLAGPMPGTDWCVAAMGLFDRVFGELASGDGARIEAVHAMWGAARAQVEGYYGAF